MIGRAVANNKREQVTPPAVFQATENDNWRTKLALKLRQLRWLPFFMAILGFVLSAGAIIYGLTAEMSYMFYRYSSLGVLPSSGLFFTLFGTLSFCTMTLASMVLTDRESLKECPEPFAFITENLLSRVGFWTAFVATSATVLVSSLANVGLSSSIFALPAIDWLSNFNYYTGLGTVFFSLSFPLLFGISGSLLIASSWALPQIENKDIILLSPSSTSNVESEAKGQLIEFTDYVAHDKEALCPVCNDYIDEEPTLCPRCHTPHHKDCWEYSDGCAIFGCDEKRWRMSKPVAQDSEALQKAVNNWALSYRAHWGLLCISVSGIVLYCLGSFFPSIYTAGALGSLVWIGQSLRFCGSAGAAMALMVYLAMLFVHQVVTYSLQKKLQLPELPRESSRRVVDSLDKTQTGETLSSFFILSIVSFLSILTIFGSTALLFPEQWLSCYPFHELVGVASLLFCFLAALQKASRVRLAYVQTVQNRLAATLKKGN
mgnify:CR=1 FL=1